MGYLKVHVAKVEILSRKRVNNELDRCGGRSVGRREVVGGRLRLRIGVKVGTGGGRWCWKGEVLLDAGG